MLGRIICRVVSWAWLCSFVVASGERYHEARALTIDDFPPCGLVCLFLAVPPTGCAFSDVSCQCQNAELAYTLSACMLENCTMADSLDTAKVQKDLCNLSTDSKTRDVYIYTIVAYSIAIVFVVLRIIGRAVTNRLAYDDYIIVAALLVTAVPLGLVLKMAEIGFGQHLWTLQQGQLLRNLRFFYVSWTTYTFVLGLTKVSLVLFYLEIFPSRPARIGSFILLGFIATSTLTLCFLTIFNCIPVQAFWNRDIKHAKCLDINTIAYANSGAAIVQDVLLLIFPLVYIQKLNMKRYKKIAVGLVFSVGTFGCIATIIRLHSLLSFKTTIDPTWDYVPVTIWTELELASCFVCVSLPAIRILLASLVPKSLMAFLTSKSHSRSTPTPKTKSTEQPTKGRGFKSWMHIPTDRDESSTGQSTELSHLFKITTMKGGNEVEETPVPDLEKDLPPHPDHEHTHGSHCLSCGRDSLSITALPTVEQSHDDESFHGTGPLESEQYARR
ncbi:hypothetical protein P280DRAFT_422749 [Massarina eburnea CBS 473.64]|uniref:CFEM domain-containing protein n=1 Tax=Massarina eburnea CBS 473.64 TaxID=1395130 RepID=A0A6A6S690_9PLEO|nr:hypothetical protein P280DRAFT_422749 [Massarina eburnea CBS 473.64]